MKRIGSSSSGLRASNSEPVVLYVEDDPDNWAVTELHLSRRFHLVWAKDDTSACDVIRERGADISAILMDIELRGSKLSGIELTQAIRGKQVPVDMPEYARNLPNLSAPIFFLTAFTSRYSDRELKAAGGNRVLAKPVNFGDLSVALASVQARSLPFEARRFLVALAQHEVTMAQVAHLQEELGSSASRLLALARCIGVAREGDDLVSIGTRHGVEAVGHLLVGHAALQMLAMPGSKPLTETLLRRACSAYLLHTFIGEEVGAARSFAVGALLEIGLVARATHDSRGAVEVSRSPAQTRALRERAAGEVEHPHRGAQIAREWALEAELVEAVERHHDPRPPNFRLGRLAWAAEWLASVYEPGAPERLWADAVRAASEVGVRVAEAEGVLTELPREVERIATRLMLQVEPQSSTSELRGASSPRLAEMDRTYGELMSLLLVLVEEKDALMSRLKAANERLAKSAGTDALTEIPNRRAFMRALRRDCAQGERQKRPVSLLMVDVDHFKRVNDTHGHQVGDEVLRHLARVLSAGMRSADYAARYGGEEFALILPDTDLPTAMQVAERLRALIEKAPIPLSGGPLALTASFGCACLPALASEGASAETLIDAADKALYSAKRGGRNRVVCGVVDLT